MTRTLQIPAEAPASFPWPDDDLAWWNFSTCLIAGWFLALGPHVDVRGLALALTASGLFLSSEWLSRLGGRSRGGEVRPVSWNVQGAGFLLLSAASLAFFLYATPRQELATWGTAVTAVACLVGLMFILRLEWRPLDGRLLYLTHLIVTLPVLVLGFLAWGVGQPMAYSLWLLPMLYFPAQALFSQYWMEGPDAPSSAMSIIGTPLLLGVLLHAMAERWVGAAFLAAFLFRSLLSLNQRRNEGRIAGFARMKRLEHERILWNVAMLLVWILG